MIKKIYWLGVLATLVYLLAFDGFNYSHDNWMTQVPASVVAALLWPFYWGIMRWL